jgi:hypothetical protein
VSTTHRERERVSVACAVAGVCAQKKKGCEHFGQRNKRRASEKLPIGMYPFRRQKKLRRGPQLKPYITDRAGDPYAI